jgi:hypothetical protein
MSPSRCAFLRASLRTRRIASVFSRTLLSEGFSKNLHRLISRNTPSRCIFFFKTLRACSTLLSRTKTCNVAILLSHPTDIAADRRRLRPLKLDRSYGSLLLFDTFTITAGKLVQ